MSFQSLQQNLNQIAQICNQLSQSEQANVSKLQQMQQAEQTASQQLRQAAQLCSQVAQQMQQLTSAQPTTAGQFGGYTTTGAGYGGGYGNWSNRPVNTGNAFIGGQSGQGGQFGTFEIGGELPPTRQAVFNTNKDLGEQQS